MPDLLEEYKAEREKAGHAGRNHRDLRHVRQNPFRHEPGGFSRSARSLFRGYNRGRCDGDQQYKCDKYRDSAAERHCAESEPLLGRVAQKACLPGEVPDRGRKDQRKDEGRRRKYRDQCSVWRDFSCSSRRRRTRSKNPM